MMLSTVLLIRGLAVRLSQRKNIWQQENEDTTVQVIRSLRLHSVLSRNEDRDWEAENKQKPYLSSGTQAILGTRCENIQVSGFWTSGS